jgi:hypothetical protein
MSRRDAMNADRGSMSVSYALLLGFIFSLTLTAVAVGIGPIQDKQSEVSVAVVDDRFNQWDDTVRETHEVGDPKQHDFDIPPGEFVVGETTTMTIVKTDQNGNQIGDETTLNTTVFEYRQHSGDDAVRISYDSGLVTNKQFATATPTVVSEPSMTTYDGPNEKHLILDFLEYDVLQPFARQGGLPEQTQINVYPNASESETVAFDELGVNEQVVITVEGPNREAWYEYFQDNGNIYSKIESDTATEQVTATVEDRETTVHINQVQFNRSVTNPTELT